VTETGEAILKNVNVVAGFAGFTDSDANIKT
jgi:hypothetical protein